MTQTCNHLSRLFYSRIQIRKKAFHYQQSGPVEEGPSFHLFHVLVALATLFVLVPLLLAQTSEPRHEFEKPGHHAGHAYDGLVPDESVDLFTGGLILRQRDIPARNLKAFDDLWPLITRSYSSKIFRQDTSTSTCNPMGTTIEDDYVGLGWSIHFGRLWDPASSNPVLELPDLSRHMFYPDSSAPMAYPDQKISKSIWILRKFTDLNGVIYEASSPGPESIRLFFHTRTTESRGTRTLLHAESWSIYKGSGTQVSTVITYKLFGGKFLPLKVEEGCGSGRQSVDFLVDSTGHLSSLRITSFTGVSEYDYSYTVRNGRYLLTKFTTPERRAYRYEYDFSTHELTKMEISTDGNFHSNDLEIVYSYASKQFYSNPDFVSKACARVITQKRVRNPNGSYDSYTYTYPSSTATSHLVTVTDPRGHKREITFQGYANVGDTVWKVGTVLSEETFQGCCTSLLEDTFTHGFVQLSNTLDPETNFLDTVKLPVLLQKTRTYSETGQQAVTTYGSASDYDRFGNPSFKIEKNFNGTTLRRTEYEYEHSDGDSDDSNMILNHFVRAVSGVKVVNGANQRVSDVAYVYHNSVTGRDFGLIKDVFTWDSATGGSIRKTHAYDTYRQLAILSEQTESSDRRTNFTTSCGMVTSVTDSLLSVAGPVFSASLDPDAWIYVQTADANGSITSYEYDSEQRIIEINPPSGDFISVDYDDQTRNVTVSQSTSETTEAYDRQGRLQTRRTKIASGKYSYQQFEYDALSNISKTSEKSLSATPTAFVTQTYDGMNRLTSIRTQDTLTEFIYDGPNVTKRVYDPNGIDTDYSYDAAGRLISVREPTGSVTNYSYDALDRLISVDQGSMERTFVYSSRGLLLSETHPESGKTTYTYDVLGRLKTKKLAGMTGTISYTYDARDRITKIDYPNDTDVKFFYDGTAVSGFNKTYVNPKSHLTGMVDATGTTLWTRFSDNGSPLGRDIYWTGFTNPVSLTYTYDTRGNLSSIFYPSQQLVELQRNDANGVEKIERQVGSQGTRILVNSIEYNAALLPSRMFFPNGIQLDVTSDARNRPRFIVAADRLRLEYQYSDRGLIDQMNFGRSTLGLKLRSYDYDPLGRLIEMDSSNAAESAGYQWDDYGNLTQKSKALSGNYTYFNNQISNVAYYASGGQVHANGRTLVYDDENRLKQVSGLGFNVTYLYDGNGNRVNSHDANSHSNRFFVYDEGNSPIAEFSQDSDGYLYVDREYVNGPSGTLVTLNYTEIPRGVTAYNLSDRVRIYWKPLSGCSTSGVHLYRSLVSGGPYELLTGDCLNTSNYYDDLNVSAGVRYFYVVKSLDDDGVEYSSSEIGHTFSTSTPNFDGPVVDYARVPAYYHLNDHLGSTRSITNQNGEEVGFFDYFPFGEPLSSQGCSPSSQRFTGKLLDTESGLQYFGARYLSNTLSRFVSVDPAAASFDPKNPQTWNRYTYGLNDPVNLIDPSGLVSIPFYGWVDAGENSGQAALDSYADTISDPNSPWYQVGGAYVGGFFSALWTPETSDETLLTLSTAWLGGAGGSTAADSIFIARSLGQAGERTASIVKNTERIISMTGTARYRIPDVLNHSGKIIGEVKNVKYLSYSKQLRDFSSYAEIYGYQFQLTTRTTTQFSGPLQYAIESGQIILKYLP